MHEHEVNRIAIGVVRKPHGVKGGLKVTLFNIDLEMLLQMEQLFVKTGNNWKQIKLKNVQGYDDYAILHFDEITDRTEADLYREHQLYADREELPDPEEDEFYFEDLIDCEVFDEHNISKGVVTEVLTPGSHDILVVSLEQEELMIPLVEEWIVSIDIHTKQIVVRSAEVV